MTYERGLQVVVYWNMESDGMCILMCYSITRLQVMAYDYSLDIMYIYKLMDPIYGKLCVMKSRCILGRYVVRKNIHA